MVRISRSFGHLNLNENQNKNRKEKKETGQNRTKLNKVFSSQFL